MKIELTPNREEDHANIVHEIGFIAIEAKTTSGKITIVETPEGVANYIAGALLQFPRKETT